MPDHTRPLRSPAVDVSKADFRAGFSALLQQASPQVVRASTFFSLPADVPPWFDTGIDLTAGESVSVFAVGRTWLARELDMWVSPEVQLWYRIGEAGQVFRGTRCSHTFLTYDTGRLFLGNYFPAEWATRTGGIALGTEAYRQREGELCILVVRWATAPLEGLKRLAAFGDIASLLSAEIDRLEHPVNPPSDWEYLWFLGPAEIYTTGTPAPQRPSIVCHAHQEVGILHKDVSSPLSPDLRLRWSWKVETLPSQAREDLLPNHDYFSIAVEFDNGQDLTYFWSAELPPETGFRCRIPTWRARETHVAVRSGHTELGRWRQEERPLSVDYERFIGSLGKRDDGFDARVVPLPTRVVRVWLIANTLFRRQEGRCEYGAIELHTGSKVMVVN